MGILFTNPKLPSIRSESVSRSMSKASTYCYTEQRHLFEIDICTNVTADRYFDKFYVGKQPVAREKILCEALVKETPEKHK